MRQKIRHTSSGEEPGTSVVMGEFQVNKAGDISLPNNINSATPNIDATSSRGDQGVGQIISPSRSILQGIIKLPTRVLILFIRIYQLLISPWLPNCCRFTPSCSHYAVEALQNHGFFRGSCLMIWRVLRCNPFCKGGLDPVPRKDCHDNNRSCFLQTLYPKKRI